MLLKSLPVSKLLTAAKNGASEAHDQCLEHHVYSLHLPLTSGLTCSWFAECLAASCRTSHASTTFLIPVRRPRQDGVDNIKPSAQLPHPQLAASSIEQTKKAQRCAYIHKANCSP
jgi:hypothetical protein